MKEQPRAHFGADGRHWDNHLAKVNTAPVRASDVRATAAYTPVQGLQSWPSWPSLMVGRTGDITRRLQGEKARGGSPSGFLFFTMNYSIHLSILSSMWTSQLSK